MPETTRLGSRHSLDIVHHVQQIAGMPRRPPPRQGCDWGMSNRDTITYNLRGPPIFFTENNGTPGTDYIL